MKKIYHVMNQYNYYMSNIIFNIINIVLVIFLYNFGFFGEQTENIYEILLGKEVQERDKAFYTPDYLVNYIIEQSIKPLLGNSKNLKVLDPSCGSRNIFSTNF